MVDQISIIAEWTDETLYKVLGQIIFGDTKDQNKIKDYINEFSGYKKYTIDATKDGRSFNTIHLVKEYSKSDVWSTGFLKNYEYKCSVIIIAEYGCYININQYTKKFGENINSNYFLTMPEKKNTNSMFYVKSYGNYNIFDFSSERPNEKQPGIMIFDYNQDNNLSISQNANFNKLTFKKGEKLTMPDTVFVSASDESNQFQSICLSWTNYLARLSGGEAWHLYRDCYTQTLEISVIPVAKFKILKSDNYKSGGGLPFLYD